KARWLPVTSGSCALVGAWVRCARARVGWVGPPAVPLALAVLPALTGPLALALPFALALACAGPLTFADGFAQAVHLSVSPLPPRTPAAPAAPRRRVLISRSQNPADPNRSYRLKCREKGRRHGRLTYGPVTRRPPVLDSNALTVGLGACTVDVLIRMQER